MPNFIWTIVGNLLGGINGADGPDELADSQCVDAVNVRQNGTKFAVKRGGATRLSTTNSSFSNVVSSLYRHIPGTDDTSAQFVGVDDSATPVVSILSGGTPWAQLTLKDAPTGRGHQFDFFSLDGKLNLLYKNAAGRVQVLESGLTTRRAGLAAPVAPTAANTGSGSYPAVLRYYRVRYSVQSAGITIRASEAGPSLAFTPSGTGASVTITKPASISEGETHWILEVSLDNGTFYELATQAVGTTTYSDSAATSTYPDGTVSISAGAYSLLPNAKFGRADARRALLFGSYTASDPQNRIVYTDIVGGGVIWAAEISPSGNNYTSILEKGAGGPTGLEGPVNGAFYAFLSNQIWQLDPTGNPLSPFITNCISPTVGAVCGRAYCIAEDEDGNACLYWMSLRGAYRSGGTGQGPINYIGYHIENFILGDESVMNTDAVIPCHVVYNAPSRQVWFYVALGTDQYPTQKFVFQIGRTVSGEPSRWLSRDTGASAEARCSAMFSANVGATMSRTLLPYVGQSGAANTILKTETANTNDAGTDYQAYVVTKVYQPWGLMNDGAVGKCFVQAKVAANVTIQQQLIGNYGETGKSATTTCVLTAKNTETRVSKRQLGQGRSNINSVQFIIGDPAASNSAWHIDRIFFETSAEGTKE